MTYSQELSRDYYVTSISHYTAKLTSLMEVAFFCPVILEKPIRIPRSLSVKAASILKGFLNKVRHVNSIENGLNMFSVS